jgi:hypothetical protein
MSRLSDILSAGLCDRLEIEKRQETEKYLEVLEFPFIFCTALMFPTHLYCADVYAPTTKDW